MDWNHDRSPHVAPPAECRQRQLRRIVNSFSASFLERRSGVQHPLSLLSASSGFPSASPDFLRKDAQMRTGEIRNDLLVESERIKTF